MDTWLPFIAALLGVIVGTATSVYAQSRQERFSRLTAAQRARDALVLDLLDSALPSLLRATVDVRVADLALKGEEDLLGKELAIADAVTSNDPLEGARRTLEATRRMAGLNARFGRTVTADTLASLRIHSLLMQIGDPRLTEVVGGYLTATKAIQNAGDQEAAAKSAIAVHAEAARVLSSHVEAARASKWVT